MFCSLTIDYSAPSDQKRSFELLSVFCNLSDPVVCNLIASDG